MGIKREMYDGGVYEPHTRMAKESYILRIIMNMLLKKVGFER